LGGPGSAPVFQTTRRLDGSARLVRCPLVLVVRLGSWQSPPVWWRGSRFSWRQWRHLELALRHLVQHAGDDHPRAVGRRRLRRVQSGVDLDRVPASADGILRPHAQPALAAVGRTRPSVGHDRARLATGGIRSGAAPRVGLRWRPGCGQARGVHARARRQTRSGRATGATE